MIYSSKYQEGNLRVGRTEIGNHFHTSQNTLKGNYYLSNTIYSKPFLNTLIDDSKITTLISSKTYNQNFPSYDYINTKKPITDTHTFQRLNPIPNKWEPQESSKNYLLKGNLHDKYKVNNFFPKKCSNLPNSRVDDLLLSHEFDYSNKHKNLGKNFSHKSNWSEKNTKSNFNINMNKNGNELFEKLHQDKIKSIENNLKSDIKSLKRIKEINQEKMNIRTELNHSEIKELMKNLDQKVQSIESIIKGNQEIKNDPTVIKVLAQLITDINRIFETQEVLEINSKDIYVNQTDIKKKFDLILSDISKLKLNLDSFNSRFKGMIISQARNSSLKSDSEELRRQNNEKNYYEILLNKLSNISEYLSLQERSNNKKDKIISEQLTSLSNLTKFPLKDIQEELRRNQEKVDLMDEKINRLMEMQAILLENPQKTIEINSKIIKDNPQREDTVSYDLHLNNHEDNFKYCKISKETLRNVGKSIKQFKNEFNILRQNANESIWEGIKEIEDLKSNLNIINNQSRKLNRIEGSQIKIKERNENLDNLNLKYNQIFKSGQEDQINYQLESQKNKQIEDDELINVDHNKIINKSKELNLNCEYPITKNLINFSNEDNNFDNINIFPKSFLDVLPPKLLSEDNHINKEQKCFNLNLFKQYTFTTFDIHKIFEGRDSKSIFLQKGIESSLDNIQIYQESLRPSNCTIEAQTEDNFSFDPELTKNEEKCFKNKQQEIILETQLGVINFENYNKDLIFGNDKKTDINIVKFEEKVHFAHSINHVINNNLMQFNLIKTKKLLSISSIFQLSFYLNPIHYFLDFNNQNNIDILPNSIIFPIQKGQKSNFFLNIHTTEDLNVEVEKQFPIQNKKLDNNIFVPWLENQVNITPASGKKIKSLLSCSEIIDIFQYYSYKKPLSTVKKIEFSNYLEITKKIENQSFINKSNFSQFEAIIGVNIIQNNNYIRSKANMQEDSLEIIQLLPNRYRINEIKENDINEQEIISNKIKKSKQNPLQILSGASLSFEMNNNLFNNFNLLNSSNAILSNPNIENEIQKENLASFSSKNDSFRTVSEVDSNPDADIENNTNQDPINFEKSIPQFPEIQKQISSRSHSHSHSLGEEILPENVNINSKLSLILKAIQNNKEIDKIGKIKKNKSMIISVSNNFYAHIPVNIFNQKLKNLQCQLLINSFEKESKNILNDQNNVDLEEDKSNYQNIKGTKFNNNYFHELYETPQIKELNSEISSSICNPDLTKQSLSIEGNNEVESKFPLNEYSSEKLKFKENQDCVQNNSMLLHDIINPNLKYETESKFDLHTTLQLFGKIEDKEKINIINKERAKESPSRNQFNEENINMNLIEENDKANTQNLFEKTEEKNLIQEDK